MSKNLRFSLKLSITLGCMLVFSTFLISFCTSRAGESGDPSLLTLDRIFNEKEFVSESLEQAQWRKDNNQYTVLEKSQNKPGEQAIVGYNPETGKREILVPPERLVPPGEKSPINIDSYEWSQNGKRLLLFTNTVKVWRRNTRGDYWVLNLENWNMHKLGSEAEPSTLMFAKFSPDNTRVGYVIKNNIFVENVDDYRIVQLTEDGSDTIINGTFDWVYEEEFSLRNGWRWSPDGKHIAYWQLDSKTVKEFYLINNTDSLYPKILPIRYPKVGETNSTCRIGIMSVEGGKTRWMKLPGDPGDHYIARMDWAGNSDEICFQWLNRLQNINWLVLGNIHSGEVKPIFSDRDDAWVEVVDDFHWVEKARYFTWLSERDGWQQVFLVSRTGEEIKCLTPGEYDVLSIENIDETGGWLYFTASPDNPTQRYLFRVSLTGSDKPDPITPLEKTGTHSYQISENSQWAFHTFSSFDNPPITELVRLPQHDAVRTLVDNLELNDKVNKLKRHKSEFFRVDIGGGVEFDAWCMKPPDFDLMKKYPLLFFVYGEPAGSTVTDRWGGNRYLWHTMLTQKGYLVISVDNRGTRVPRGREWRKIIYRQIGILASADQAAAARSILASKPYIDPNRIGIWGWSGGGSMSLNAIFRYPDLYNTALAIAFVSNQRYYDTIYQERYMGLPNDNPEGFQNGSPITYAHKLKGNLLIVHGTGDDNVHYQGFEALVNELIEHNKIFTMMAYPNRTHGISEGENTTLHLYGLLTRYLEQNLPAERED